MNAATESAVKIQGRRDLCAGLATHVEAHRSQARLHLIRRANVVDTAVMALDPRLLEVIACPEDHGPLMYFGAEGFLYNPRLKRKYLVAHDVPVLLIGESVSVSTAEHEQVISRAEAGGIRPNF